LKDVHREAARKAENQVIGKALEMTNWNRKRAAKLLISVIRVFSINPRPAGFTKEENLKTIWNNDSFWPHNGFMKDISQVFFAHCLKMDEIKATIGNIAGTDLTI